MIVISGASNNHFLTFINFIDSFINNNINSLLILYNLGFDDEKWNFIKNKYNMNTNIIYKNFDFSKYPEWFDIKINAGQYAWKPTIIYDISLDFPNEILIWMDAGNLIHNNLNDLEKFLIKNGVYSAISSGTILDWTHPSTIKYMNCTFINEKNRNGACIGFNLNKKIAKNLLEDFYKYSHIKDCIYPNGSSRENHRHDQSVFTILYYKYLKEENNILICDDYLGYTLHNDID